MPPDAAQVQLALNERKKLKSPRIDWAELFRRTLLEDVLRYPFGETRRIVAVVKDSDEALASLKRSGERRGDGSGYLAHGTERAGP